MITENFDDIYTEFSASLDGKSADQALISINKWLKDNSNLLENAEVPTNNTVQEQTKNSLVNSFPIILDKKETNFFVKPEVQDEDYVEFLKNEGKSYKNLPEPNVKIEKIDDIFPNFNFGWQNITKLDVKEYILTRSDKGKDFYGLSFKTLKSAITKSENLLNHITNYYNEMFKSNSNLCKEWTTASIKAVFKGGDKSDPKRYRPLTILPLMVRIFDGIISKKIHDICLMDDKIVDKSIQSAILKEKNGLWENTYSINKKIIRNYVQTKSTNILLFLDIKNAYGSVNYGLMEKIIEKMNLGEHIKNYFRRYYSAVFAKYKSKEFVWKNGLLQGSALSNILFLIYMNVAIKNVLSDLEMIGLGFSSENFNSKDDIFGFVDDFAIDFPRDSKMDERFEFIEIIFSLFNFEINFNKTFFLSSNENETELNFGSNIIKRVKEDFKYLGSHLYVFYDFIMDSYFSKIKEGMIQIDSMNISTNIKNYIFYHVIFMRLFRHIECLYLLNGFNNKFDKLFKLMKYFLIRFDKSYQIKNPQKYDNFHKDLSNYLMTKIKEKQDKYQINIFNDTFETVKNKYNFDRFLLQSEIGFEGFFGENIPSLIDLDNSLKSVKNSNTFPKEHFSKIKRTFYSSNFVEFID